MKKMLFQSHLHLHTQCYNLKRTASQVRNIFSGYRKFYMYALYMYFFHPEMGQHTAMTFG